MSITREIVVWCDTCGHWERFPAKVASSVSTARKKLKAHGWSSTKWKEGGIKDYCPKCVEDKQNEPRN